MAERLTDPRTIQQQEQQHTERNRSAVQRALQHARHEEDQDERKVPNSGPAPQKTKPFIGTCRNRRTPAPTITDVDPVVRPILWKTACRPRG